MFDLACFALIRWQSIVFIYTAVDFAEALNLFPAHNDRYNDVENMLPSIVQLQEDCQYVRKFLALNSDSNLFHL